MSLLELSGVNARIQAAQNISLSGKDIEKIVRKTGTTICGLKFKDGIVLGADTRSTAGSIVADKNCEKIHRISDHIFCCGAGTAADCDYVTRMISSDIELHRLEANIDKAPVEMAKTILRRYLFKYQGHVSAALVLGGVDNEGFHLYSISPNGASFSQPYVTMGSGSLAAMAVFEQGFKPEMELDVAKKLVRDAIAAGVFNDLGSGSNIDMCVITKDSVDYIRPYEIANVAGVKNKSYKVPNGTQTLLRPPVMIPIECCETIEEPMEE